MCDQVMGEGRDISTTLVAEAMTQRVACIPAKSTIYECSKQMKRLGIRRLAVVDNWYVLEMLHIYTCI